MQIKDLKVVFLRRADKSDPLNVSVTACAKAFVDGVLCGWTATILESDNFEDDESRVVALLIAKILTNPRNALEISGFEPGPQVIVPDVAILEGMTAADPAEEKASAEKLAEVQRNIRHV